MRSKLSARAPPWIYLFRGIHLWGYFRWFWVHFWRPFGTLWAHFGALVAQIEALLVPFRATFWLFRTLGVSFWLVLGEIHLLRQKFAKNTPALTLASNFLQIFACKLSSLGPGAELLPQATEIRPRAACGPPRACWHSVAVLQVSILHAPFPAVGLFLQYSFFL